MIGATKHSYEEIREVVVDIMLGKEQVGYTPNQWQHLIDGVKEVFDRREHPGNHHQTGLRASLHSEDAELVRDVFWDLFRQGVITMGYNDSNPNWPFFRLSYKGDKILRGSTPYRFHDSSSYLTLVKTADPDILPETVTYLDEASATFYAECRLSTCVMLGAAAESEFLRLLDVTTKGPQATKFSKATAEKFVLPKIRRFLDAVTPLVSGFSAPKDFESLDANFSAIQALIRTARNDAGHPTAVTVPSREQVYVYLQLFVPFAKQVRVLREALK